MANLDEYYELLHKGAYQKAYKTLQSIIKNQPWSIDGDIYIECAILEILINDDINKARDFLKKAFDRGCYFMDRYYRICGYISWKTGDYAKAIKNLKESISLNPNLNVTKTIGILLSQEYDKQSIEIWQNVLKKEPKSCLAYVYLGKEAWRSGYKELSKTMVAHATELAHSSDDFFEIGFFYCEQKQYKKALKAFNKCKKLGYKNTIELYNSISRCFLGMNDFVNVAQYLNKIFELDPNNDYAKGLLLNVTLADNSEHFFDNKILKKSDTCLYYVIHAQQALKQECYNKTEELILKAIQLEPSPSEMFYIGLLYYYLGYPEKALNSYLISKRLGYNNKILLYNSIARCHYDLENFEESIKYTKAVIYCDINDEDAKDILISSVEFVEKEFNTHSLFEAKSHICLKYILDAKNAERNKDAYKALELTKKAEHLDPSPTELYHIGRLYNLLGCTERAIQFYKEAEIKNFHNKVVLYNAIAASYALLGKNILSIHNAIKSLSININDDNAMDILLWSASKESVNSTLRDFIGKNQGRCFVFIIHALETIGQKDFIKTKQMIQKAEKLNPSSIEMLYISYVYHNLGDMKKAIKACLRSENLGYDDKCRIYSLLAEYYYWLDDYDNSIRYALKVLSIVNDDDEAKEFLYACREEAWGKDFGDNY